MKRFFVRAALVAALVLFAAKAEAGFVVSGGSPGQIPGATLLIFNNSAITPKLVPTYFDDDGFPGVQIDGYYGAQLRFTGANAGDQFKFEYFGAEAGGANAFQVNSPAWPTVFTHTTGDTTSGTPLASATYNATDILTGDLLEFRFLRNGSTSAAATNGTNPDHDVTNTPNFALAQDKLGGWFLFFDDLGQSDDNHDDMVVRITHVPATIGPAVVPVPPSMVLALAGAGSFSVLPLLRRMRRRVAA